MESDPITNDPRLIMSAVPRLMVHCWNTSAFIFMFAVLALFALSITAFTEPLSTGEAPESYVRIPMKYSPEVEGLVIWLLAKVTEMSTPVAADPAVIVTVTVFPEIDLLVVVMPVPATVISPATRPVSENSEGKFRANVPLVGMAPIVVKLMTGLLTTPSVSGFIVMDVVVKLAA